MHNLLKSNKLQKTILATLVASVLAPNLWADSPPNPVNDTKWLHEGFDIHDPATTNLNTFATGADKTIIIEAAFNRARRAEEAHFGLADNFLKDLDLPSQTVWDGLTDEQKALYIINDERLVRAGMKPNVLGLPFAGVSDGIDMIADEYTAILIDNNMVGHDKPSNTTADGFFARLDRSPTLKDCHQNVARGENVAWYGSLGGTSIPLALERAIYQWIYDDSAPAVGAPWGHREMVLLQDKTLAGAVNGFQNDDGSDLHEGYIGFQSTGSADYKPFKDAAGNTVQTTFAQAIVLQYFDPVNEGTAGCAFSVTHKTEDLPGNTAPVAINDSITTAFNTASAVISVLTNDTDTENDTLSVIANTTPTNGTVVKTGNTFIYTPTTDFNGSDSFEYTLSDGKLTSIGTVNITVNANGVPVATTDTVTVAFNTASAAISVLANDTDPEGSDLTLTGNTNPANGTLTITGNTFVYTPNTDFTGTDSFTYTISDGTLTTEGTVNITVNENAAPTAVADAVTTAFNTATTTINVLANDTDAEGATLTVTGNTEPTNGSVEKTDNTFIYTPNADYSGRDTFTYTVSDGTLSSTGTVNVTVSAKVEESSGGGSVGFGIFGLSLLGLVGLVRRRLAFSVR